MKKTATRLASVLTVPVIALTACTTPATSRSSAQSDGAITVTNCEKELTIPGPARKLYVNDGNIIALTLAVGAADQITAVSSLGRDKPILRKKYGDVVDRLNEVSKDYPTLESVVAANPDLMVAGWNYGFSEGKNITPDILAEKGIQSYLLTESCRQKGSTKRGIVDPWEAVRADLSNLGSLTGHRDEAKAVVEDMDARLKTLDQAQKPGKKPVVFVFDSAKDTVFTSGSFGAPHAIIETAGGTNATADIGDTWTTVAWEKVSTSKPDVIAMVEYPGQTYEEKVQLLKEHPATKDLAAVKEERFVNLPYALWTASPMNVDAAEYLRKAFEKYGLAPKSEVKTHLEMPSELPGLGKLP